MNEAKARTVLIIRAVENADAHGALLPWAERRDAARTSTLEGGSVTAEPKPADDRPLQAAEEAFLARRAAVLLDKLGSRWPEIGGWARPTSRRGLMGSIVALVALAVGWCSNELGTEGRIHLITFPFLGLLVWNLGFYLWRLALWRPRARHGSRTFPVGLLQRLGREASAIWNVPRWTRATGDDAVRRRALGQYWTDWMTRSVPLQAARLGVCLHVAAALLAVGLVGGMYWRGLAREYRAGWESTFLNADSVHRFLRLMLGPASFVSGIPIPSVEHLETLRWDDGQRGENAAPWIHLYAWTAGLFIVGPRLGLAMAAGLRARQASRRFPLPTANDPYFRRWLTFGSDQQRRVQVVPYSSPVTDTTRQACEERLAGALGWQVRVEWSPPVPYGEEESWLQQQTESGAWARSEGWLLLFSLASTPEPECHGRFMRGVRLGLEQSGAHAGAWAVLDETEYVRRLASLPSAMSPLETRRKLWRQAAEQAGLTVLPLNADDPQTDVWPIQFDGTPVAQATA